MRSRALLRPTLCISIFALVFAVPVFAQDTPAPAAAPAAYAGQLKSPDGADLGRLTLIPGPDGVILRIEAHGLTPGWHGMHFHEKGACTDDKFASAGGHVHMTTPVVHGFLNSGHNDAGDLPNLYVGADGTATVELFSNLVTATKTGDKPYLMDDDGSAVIIHAMPDDYLSQPIGGAGVRVACAVITPSAPVVASAAN